MNPHDCGECGAQDCEPEYIPCCAVYMCDRCEDKHQAKHGPLAEESGEA